MVEKQVEIVESEGFTVVYNDLIQDGRLRLQTRAVLILMLSKPKDWDFSIRGMAAIADVSKDTMSRMVSELEEAGYLQRKKQVRAAGRFDKAGFRVAGRPIFLQDKSPEAEEDAPCPNFSYTKESYAKNSPQQNKEQVNKEQERPPKSPKGDSAQGSAKEKRTAPDWKPERFAGFWKLYPRGESKQDAIRAWDKLKPSDELLAVMGQALVRQMASRGWRDGVGIPYAATWLNNARWEDEVKAPPAIDDDTGSTWAEDDEVMD